MAHVVEAIDRIDRYTAGMGEEAFLSNQMVQDAVIRNLGIIAEASNNIHRHYPDFAAAQPELPLSLAHQMGNALARDYFKVDVEIVWRTILRELPSLRSRVQRALSQVQGKDL